VQSIAFGMTLADGVESRLEVTTGSPQSAERLQTLLDAQLVMLSETAIVHVLGLGPALKRTRTAASGDQVTAFTYVDEATLKQAVQAATALGLAVQVETAPPAEAPGAPQKGMPGHGLPPNTY
jgi:hypothetical protein